MTSLRELAFQETDACRVLSRPALAYRDGSEERLYELVRGARDISSLSDELEQAATTWPELYHVAKSRANSLRPFSLHEGLKVLEVGAGCGPLTRYLGERCGPVDALEPVLERARIARIRTRDLDNVEVFVGEVADVPPRAAYDLVVLVGVLEYVGGGSARPDDYIRFLQRLARVLRPGGHIICAIENRLGVKYLAGSPEDHTARVFDGVEDYPRGGPARTFSRRQLTALFRQSGLHTSFFHAFPDYKLPRAVFSDALLEMPVEGSLAWRLPNFPSPDRAGVRPHLAEERRLWRSLVEAGLGGHFSNSFVVVGARRPSQKIWPSDLVAAVYNTERRALFSTETRAHRISSTLRLERSRLAGGERRLECGPLVHHLSDSDFTPGADLVDLIAACDKDAVRQWLQRWAQFISSAGLNAGLPDLTSIDLVPHNAIVPDSGEIVVIDQEWWHRAYEETDVLGRGILWLAWHLADRSPPEKWGVESIGELALLLGASAGLDSGSGWTARAAEREAEVQALVRDSSPGDEGWERAVRNHRSQLSDLLDRALADTALGPREQELRLRAEALLQESRTHAAAFEREMRAALAQTEAALAETGASLAETRGRLNELSARYQAVTSSRGYRLLETYRRWVRWLFPQGSIRAVPYRALRRLGRWLLDRR